MILTPDTIRNALDTAPGWCKIAISMPQQKLREDGETELAGHLYECLTGGRRGQEEGQLALPL